ncbi:MAG TPA: hypothetical protein DDZ83_03360 [Nitrospinae bacterium]|nr:hypothetical protein [Nitrospinota bacterium]
MKFQTGDLLPARRKLRTEIAVDSGHSWFSDGAPIWVLKTGKIHLIQIIKIFNRKTGISLPIK